MAAAQTEGRYFLLKQPASGLTLEIPLPAYEVYVPPKTPIYMWSVKSVAEGNQSQLWYEDRPSNTIRSKINHYCLDVENNRVMVNPYKPSASSQQWLLSGDRVVCARDGSLVLAAGGSDLGADVRTTEIDTNSVLQQWVTERLPATPFYITSKLHGKAVDVARGKKAPGTPILMWPKNTPIAQHQLWYEDLDGIIRSRLHDFALEPDAKGFLKCQPYDPKNPRQKWHISGDHIVNRHNAQEAWDVFKESKKNNTPVMCYEYHNGENQQWRFEYVNL